VEKNLKSPAFYLNEAGLFYSGAPVIPRLKITRKILTPVVILLRSKTDWEKWKKFSTFPNLFPLFLDAMKLAIFKSIAKAIAYHPIRFWPEFCCYYQMNSNFSA
jgi:hypothetical protein